MGVVQYWFLPDDMFGVRYSNLPNCEFVVVQVVPVGVPYWFLPDERDETKMTPATFEEMAESAAQEVEVRYALNCRIAELQVSESIQPAVSWVQLRPPPPTRQLSPPKVCSPACNIYPNRVMQLKVVLALRCSGRRGWCSGVSPPTTCMGTQIELSACRLRCGIMFV